MNANTEDCGGWDESMLPSMKEELSRQYQLPVEMLFPSDIEAEAAKAYFDRVSKLLDQYSAHLAPAPWAGLAVPQDWIKGTVTGRFSSSKPFAYEVPSSEEMKELKQAAYLYMYGGGLEAGGRAVLIETDLCDIELRALAYHADISTVGNTHSDSLLIMGDKLLHNDMIMPQTAWEEFMNAHLPHKLAHPEPDAEYDGPPRNRHERRAALSKKRGAAKGTDRKHPHANAKIGTVICR